MCNFQDQTSRETILHQMANMSSAQIVSASVQNKSSGLPGLAGAPLAYGSQVMYAPPALLCTLL